ncbi:endonuclease/exonuclease/phosphatase family protein [Roseibium denhamense]|uniref:Endonuclease/Exonuclease/phosphatase family protein n=1 Tax=Roseibium denhamense TaxID=76305 RepID=A0ABY1P894_9HYPH|nr:endonuclease/exonuclease/phosphatase family protein [Roseibium denhamense]MTI07329.1 endonuclease/exonuclease/phosphatase family protein [Roseibium denhamense]SMP28821.1 Endonuclease/Exonuclease/phosphatase family protein [Roseibium denhamense]
MRLATFNIESFGDDRLDPDGLAPRISALRPQLLELDADILCLQEVNAQKPKGVKIRSFNALRHLLEDTPYATYHFASSLRPSGKGPGDRHNLVVLSKYPILSAESHYQTHAHPALWQPTTAIPMAKAAAPVTFERPVLKTVIDLGLPKPLHVFAVHLRAPIAAMIPGGKNADRTWRSISAWAEGYQLSVFQRTTQALELRLAVERLFDEDSDAQIVLAGDFNATGDTSTLRLLRADPDDTGSPALAHRRLYQLDAALAPEQRQTVLHRGKGQALDHILTSPSLTDKVQGVRVFNANLADEVLHDGGPDFAGSFHAAMCADFDLT